MTRLVFKLLMIAGAFFYFGGHMPLDGDGSAFALPQVSCEADFASCRIGEREVALGDRSTLLAEIIAKAKGTPGEELKQALGDPELVRLLDQQVIPEFAVAAAQTHLAGVAHQIIAGIDTGAGQARRAD
ncbi:MAG: hypothetical protein U0942_03105 [Parvibaculum sp.]|uniref:hypothetical protein n=1 Tax=Parvibaculum sp. TaxID=2024848 RepID=UPI002AB81B70|nr:hypothetical protein [Parvibaculum sp.]MDZ4380309.1 hypothetical protein [Parvibaculum sp.]